MAITMVVRNGQQETVETSNVPWAPHAAWLVPSSTPLLIGVDPVGNTVFNARQCARQLLTELESLQRQVRDDQEAKAMLGELRRLVLATKRPPHRMLWFLGD